ncbi:hypothetical protein [Citreimonas salinaria]|nr:hypothetical protein [Citreimonas salinaria]
MIARFPGIRVAQTRHGVAALPLPLIQSDHPRDMFEQKKREGAA